MATLLRIVGLRKIPHFLMKPNVPLFMKGVPMATTQYGEEESYWEKNKRLNRPISPHMTIYRPQWTWTLSITFRFCGVGLGLGMYAFSLGMLMSSHDFTHLAQIIKGWNLAPATLYSLKLMAAWPLTYHFLNGVRHLAWDLGHGFEINTLQKTGMIVLGSSVLIAGLLAGL